MPPDQAELERWLVKAEHDQRAAEVLLREMPPITDAAAFHCQQAAEKLLKAFLFSRSVDFEKTHDLRRLTLRCAENDPAFRPWCDTLAALTAFAVRFRYPGPADPTPQQVKDALEQVVLFRKFVRDRL